MGSFRSATCTCIDQHAVLSRIVLRLPVLCCRGFFFPFSSFALGKCSKSSKYLEIYLNPKMERLSFWVIGEERVCVQVSN